MSNNQKFESLKEAGRYVDATSDRTIFDEINYSLLKLKLKSEENKRKESERKALLSLNFSIKRKSNIVEKVNRVIKSLFV